MKRVLFLCLLLTSVNALAKKGDAKSLNRTIAAFDKALVEKDSVTLKLLLNEQVKYGHSNGWIENKKEVIADLYNGTLTYKKINTTVPDIVIAGNTAAVRTNVEIEAEMTGTAMSFKLKVLQVWIWKGKHWTLLARQSVKNG